MVMRFDPFRDLDRLAQQACRHADPRPIVPRYGCDLGASPISRPALLLAQVTSGLSLAARVVRSRERLGWAWRVVRARTSAGKGNA